MANWWGESPQQEYFRRQNNKEKWGNAGGPIDAVAHWLFKLFAPILIPVLLVVYFFKLYWMYVIPIAVIVIVCFFTCKHFRRMGRSSDSKVFLTVFISLVLIGGVFIIAPGIKNSGTGTIVSRNQTALIQTKYMLVNADALNVRKGSSINHDVVGQLLRNTRVQVLDNSGVWWRIKAGNIEGYVNSTYLVNE